MHQNQCADAESKNPRLQVLIVAYGNKGIDSIAQLSHPVVKGVEYIVSWQYADADPNDIPPALLEREDFHIYPSSTRGVAKNRNLVLEKATAPLLLSSDDDVSYTEQQLLGVIRAFDLRPDSDFISFRYHSPENPREYPPHECALNRRLPKNFFTTGIEMAWRRDAILKHNIHFDELFGIGGFFCAAEEDLFFNEVRKNKIPATFVPFDVCTHTSDSTCMRIGHTREFIRTKGAAVSIINPFTWPLRMITHALREKGNLKKKWGYCTDWLSGVRDLWRLRRNEKKILK